jgi:thioredoxin reductase
VTLCSNGGARLLPSQAAQLARHGVEVHESRIAALEHEAGHARHVLLRDGRRVACDEVFLVTAQRPQCELPRNLGCDVTRQGVVKTDRFGQTGVPGLYVAGDASRDVQFAIVAAAEGAKAGVAINKALQAGAGQAAAG